MYKKQIYNIIILKQIFISYFFTLFINDCCFVINGVGLYSHWLNIGRVRD